MAEWQDIASAPKDGTLVWLGRPGMCRVGYWRSGQQHENHGTVDGGWADFHVAEAGRGPCGLRYEATCWQPLPEPPK